MTASSSVALSTRWPGSGGYPPTITRAGWEPAAAVLGALSHPVGCGCCNGCSTAPPPLRAGRGRVPRHHWSAPHHLRALVAAAGSPRPAAAAGAFPHPRHPPPGVIVAAPRDEDVMTTFSFETRRPTAAGGGTCVRSWSSASSAASSSAPASAHGGPKTRPWARPATATRAGRRRARRAGQRPRLRPPVGRPGPRRPGAFAGLGSTDGVTPQPTDPVRAGLDHQDLHGMLLADAVQRVRWRWRTPLEVPDRARRSPAGEAPCSSWPPTAPACRRSPPPDPARCWPPWATRTRTTSPSPR